jgi:hypothetical protein
MVLGNDAAGFYILSGSNDILSNRGIDVTLFLDRGERIIGRFLVLFRPGLHAIQ